MDRAKPFDIPKREVWEAYKKVRANQAAAGVDGQSIADFEAELANNLYKLCPRLRRRSGIVHEKLRFSTSTASTSRRDAETVAENSTFERDPGAELYVDRHGHLCDERSRGLRNSEARSRRTLR